jgi:transposase
VPRAAGQEKKATRTAWLPQFFDHTCDPGRVRTAYRCRAYPDPAQQQVLARTFGCVRVVWNRTLAARQARYAADGTGTSYAQADRALTAMKKDPGLAFLNEVSCVPLQQALRHQHQAFAAFFAWRARYPRVKSRRSRQSAHYTRSACGYLLAELKLGTRHWTCPSCGTRHDRDLNAAKNILAAGRAVARGSPGGACGAGIRHSGSSRVQPAVKQETRPVTAGIPVLHGEE